MRLMSLGQRIRRIGSRFLARSAARPRGRVGGGAPTEITIGTAVVAPNPERFGTNIDIPGYQPWALNAPMVNCWIADGGMEPIILRHKGTATGGSATSIENDGGPTTSAGETIGDGFFDGATVRVYRVVDGEARLVRTATVARYLASAPSGYRILLDGEGPAVQAGDVYFLSLIRDDLPVELLHPRLRHMAGMDTWRIYPNGGELSGVATRRDAGSVAPEHGSRTSLRIAILGTTEGGIYQYLTGAAEQRIFNAFEPGRTYRAELWLRQQGVAGGEVAVWLAPYRGTIGRSFRVSGTWGAYRFTFRAPRRLSRGALTALHITFHGPGTLWVDDVQLSDTRLPAYAVRPEVFRALREFHPGTLRIWSGQTNTAWGTTLDNWLAPDGRGMRLWEPGRGPAPCSPFSLPTALALARSIGATPWLIVSVSFDEAEWRGLIEYLAGPPSSPYGARRAAGGQARAWTDEFARIRIEYGNEAWNVLPSHPWTFGSGTRYGQLAEYFFGVAKASPHYPPVADRVDFVLGGYGRTTWPRTYGALARQASPSSSIVGLPCYLAGWEGRELPSNTREEQFQNTLLYAPGIMHHLTDRQVAARNLLSKMGCAARLATSESGSRYTPPTPHTPFNPVQEEIGKSLAAGVGLLDAFLYDTARGYGPQAYYAFGVGLGWASHTARSKGFRPHPNWLALGLRNRHGEGEMIATTVIGSPQVDLPEVDSEGYRIPARAGIPLIAAYAFRKDGRHAIFVLSRRLSEPTPVTLYLPTTPLAATLYTLAGDPRATNVDRMTVRIRRRAVRRFATGYTFDMPPGSIYLFVFDAAHPPPRTPSAGGGTGT